jgi:ATP phosphoribosyltransferase
MYIENILAISELNILKRLKVIETMLELNDYPIEDNEAESTITKQISLLSDQIKKVIKINNKQSILEPIPRFRCKNNISAI